MMQTMESPQGKSADMLAVFLLESKHSSLDRILNKSNSELANQMSELPVTKILLVWVQELCDCVRVAARTKGANVKLVEGRDFLQKL